MTLPKVLSNDLIDSLLSRYKKSEDLIGENGLFKPLTNRWLSEPTFRYLLIKLDDSS